MKTTNRFAALMLSLTLGAGVLALPIGAQASEEGQRNTALGLGAAAAALLLTQKNKLPGIVAAGGAALAYSQYDASIRDRHRREGDYGYYPNDYRNNGYRYHEDYRGHDSDRYHDDSRNHSDYRNDYHEQGGSHGSGGYRNDGSESTGGYRYGENSAPRNGGYDGRTARMASATPRR